MEISAEQTSGENIASNDQKSQKRRRKSENSHPTTRSSDNESDKASSAGGGGRRKAATTPKNAREEDDAAYVDDTPKRSRKRRAPNRSGEAAPASAAADGVAVRKSSRASKSISIFSPFFEPRSWREDDKRKERHGIAEEVGGVFRGRLWGGVDGWGGGEGELKSRAILRNMRNTGLALENFELRSWLEDDKCKERHGAEEINAVFLWPDVWWCGWVGGLLKSWALLRNMGNTGLVFENFELRS